MKNKKLFSKIMAWSIIPALICNLFPLQSLRAEELPDHPAQKVIEINTADDFLSFAANCFLDSWSADKKFVLNADIDLEGVEFGAIPVFAGTFDGKNHTISGFRYSGDGYVAGLFRYIEKEGLVENLKLKGEIIASDEKECIGGLCGVNYGTIQNCSFQGNVSGKTTVGGFAGVNEGTGTIRNCTMGGRVTGYYSTGGFVGKNHGLLSYCSNRSCVNNDSEWVEEDDEMGMGLFLSINISGSGTELFSGVDTGGIAGYSDGTITGCTNYGRIGYEHTGYNIGGIAGRQCGIVSLCTNTGAVYGRKDVGGIIGQMEPYIEVDEAASLRNAVNKLHDLIEKTIDDMEEGKNAIKGDLDELTSYSDGAADASDALAGQIADFTDENLDQAQSMADRLSHVMDMLPDVFDDVYAAEDSFSNANKTLLLIADELKNAGNIEGEYIETDYGRLALLSTVGGNIISLQHYPAAGETVHILAEPDNNYQLDHMNIIDGNGNSVYIQKEDEKNYTFTMPEPNVRVEAYFSYQGGETEFENGVEEAGQPGPKEDAADIDMEETENTEGKKDAADIPDNGTANAPANGAAGGENGGTANAPANSATDGGTDGATNTPGSGSADEKTDGAANSPGSGAADGENGGTANAPGSGAADGENGGTANAPGNSATDGGTDGATNTPGSGAADGKNDGAANASGSGSADTESSTEESEKDGNIPDGINVSDNGQQILKSDSQYIPKLLMAEAGERGSVKEISKETAQTVIRLSSNLSGNASYETDGSTATVTVIPDEAYTVDGIPSVTADGQPVSASKSQEGEYTYTFGISSGTTYQVNIIFRKMDKSEAAGNAKGNIHDAIKKQQAATENVNAIIQEIQSSSDITSEQLSRLAEELGKMLNASSAVLANLNMAANIWGQQISDKINSIGSSMPEVLEQLQNAVDSVKSATRDAGSIVDYVNGQPNLHFSKLGSEFDANRENLHGQLRGISGSIKNLSNHASDYSDVVNDDLRAVNDQINVIFNLLADNVMNYGDISVEELYEDVDIEDTEAITSGKADNCRNKGVIKGDINVGGIAGAMSIDEEDPEDSAAGSVDYQIGRRYFTKCIITKSVNEGYVTAKKDGAGGITGYMRHGIVVDSEGYGSVESTEGDYVGGICGESFTVIKRCYALCSVSGGKNVGGIAGFADTLKDCYAMADCRAKKGRVGAIAGQTVNYDDALNEEEIKVSGNYYVGDNIYGIDNISYIGVAEPVSYEKLLTAENLPTEFRHLKVIFRIDDLYLGTQEVEFGKKLSQLDYPEIPEKQGYYGVWPDCSDQVVTGNLLIEGEYKEDVTVVQSNAGQAAEEQSKWEKPYALVEQRFTEDTVLNAEISDKEPPEDAQNKQYVVYDISLEYAQIGSADTFAIRLYNPYNDVAVWGYKDGMWTKMESKKRGQYVQVYMTGPKQSFCIIEQKSKIWIAIAGATGGILFLLLLAAGIKKVKRKHKK